MSSMALSLVMVMVLIVVLLLVVWLTPTSLRYTESIIIEAPSRTLYDNTRLQSRLMDWSAWPSETKSTCSTENTDGELGARTVFFSKGKRFGHQEVTALVNGQRVELMLESKGPPQKPLLSFEFIPLGVTRTEVRLHFSNTLSRPFNVILRLVGICLLYTSPSPRDH
jgi:hypothetical protein